MDFFLAFTAQLGAKNGVPERSYTFRPAKAGSTPMTGSFSDVMVSKWDLRMRNFFVMSQQKCQNFEKLHNKNDSKCQALGVGFKPVGDFFARFPTFSDKMKTDKKLRLRF